MPYAVFCKKCEKGFFVDESYDVFTCEKCDPLKIIQEKTKNSKLKVMPKKLGVKFSKDIYDSRTGKTHRLE